ncbi:hypothetical protein SAMN05216244_3947 [Sediminibacillus halophilus]|uniref:Uncharacterized protein n=1 Tax=Sediminibacillus halophilus TaxID=482461 RepID=A0A1G9XSF1_9BACI|nr:hypothetical protein SAMN05216244_3947 [Sediminibacillus halophilus]
MKVVNTNVLQALTVKVGVVRTASTRVATRVNSRPFFHKGTRVYFFILGNIEFGHALYRVSKKSESRIKIGN